MSHPSPSYSPLLPASDRDPFLPTPSAAPRPTSRRAAARTVVIVLGLVVAISLVSASCTSRNPRQVVSLDVGPTSRPYRPLDGEKYLGYLPHSGWNNQRSALTNALYLGALLNRTVLVPPVWIGWPTGLEFYPELQRTWDAQIQSHPSTFDSYGPLRAHPIRFASTSDSFPSETGLSLAARLEALNHTRTAKQAHWKSLGYELGPNGYPVTNQTLHECKATRPECRAAFVGLDTFVAWDKLVAIEDRLVDPGVVRVRDRWDLREESLLDSLGIEQHDVLVFEDADKYDFQFVDHSEPRRGGGRGRQQRRPSRPLISNSTSRNHFVRTVSIPAMRELPHTVLLVGSLFGHQRVYSELRPSSSDESDGAVNPKALTGQALFRYIQASLSLSNEHVLGPAREIRHLLRREGEYVGVHARVGDGVFEKNQVDNMWELWRRVGTRLGIEGNALDVEETRLRGIIDDEVRAARTESIDPIDKRRYEHGDPASRSLEHEDEGMLPRLDDTARIGTTSTLVSRRSHLESTRLLPSTAARRRPNSDLTCHGRLHDADSPLAAFNVRMYLATDAPSPSTLASLRPFFLSFPCISLLASFQHLESVQTMQKLVNARDGVKLASLFVPFLEATVAAMADQVVGTRGSTFSAYAETTLHNAFAMDSTSSEESSKSL